MRISSLIMLLAAIACGNPTGTDRDIEVTVTTSMQTIGRAAPAIITVTTTYRGAGAVTLSESSCPQRFVVLNDRDEVVAPHPTHICNTGLPAVTLQSGESVQFEYAWNALDSAVPGTPVAPGTYRLRGYAYGARRVVTSEPVSITVVP